jgi:hypothetical protein
LGILAHGNTPTRGKARVCMERALKARQKHGPKGLLINGLVRQRQRHDAVMCCIGVTFPATVLKAVPESLSQGATAC